MSIVTNRQESKKLHFSVIAYTHRNRLIFYRFYNALDSGVRGYVGRDTTHTPVSLHPRILSQLMIFIRNPPLGAPDSPERR